MKNKLTGLIAVAAMFMTVLTPLTADAKTRQQTKNEWRNIGYGAAALGILGLIKKDSTLTFVGTTGALYSAYRYEQDRKSQNKANRYRYQTFRNGTYVRDGHKYKRYTKWKNGKKYYYFRRVS